MSRRGWPLIFSLSLMVFCGCQNDDDIVTYRVSKEIEPSKPTAAPHSNFTAEPPDSQGSRDSNASRSPEMTWKIPAGWTEQTPLAMRVGSFLIKESNGQTADVSIIPLSGMAGGNLANINRWRGQIGLDPIGEDSLSRESHSIAPGGRTMVLVDFSNQNRRVIAAIYTQSDRTWFFKMMGDAGAVGNSKASFLQFLNTVHFHEP